MIWPYTFPVLILLSTTSYSTSKDIDDSFGPQEAANHQFPYMVSLRRTEHEVMLHKEIHICAGALISETIVVTAAHCIFDMFGNYVGNENTFMVVAGSSYINATVSNTVRRLVSKIFVYPAYMSATREADIAALILRRELHADSSNVRIVDLATSRLEAGSKCYVLGWNNYFVTNLSANVLQSYGVQLLSDDICQRYNKGRGTYLPGKQLCTCPTLSTMNGKICNNANLCREPDDYDYSGEVSMGHPPPGGGPPPASPSLPKLSSLEVVHPRVYPDSGDPGGILVCNNKIAGLLAYSYKCIDLTNSPQIFTEIREYVDFLRDPENYLPEMAGLLVRTDSSYGDGSVSKVFSLECMAFNMLLTIVLILIGNIIIF